MLTAALAVGCGESDRNESPEQGYSLQVVASKPPIEQKKQPTLRKIEIESGSQKIASSIRVVFSFSAPTQYALETNEGTCRLLAQGRLDPSISSSVDTGWGKASQLQLHHQKDRIEIAAHTDPSVQCRAFHLVQPFRVLLDLSAPSVQNARPIIVLDPGHGGEDFGARARGLHESDLALDIARRVGGILERADRDILVLQTRTDDRFIPLERRVAFANAVGAMAFVSIHLNSADEQVRRGGVSTFVLDTSGSAQARKLAAHENGTSLAGVTELQTLLASLHREDQLRESQRLAEYVQQGVLVGTSQTLPNIYDRGVRKALFAVLVGARMPAVLVEGSFLTQPEEAAALAKGGYRQDIARGIASGVLRYVSAKR